MDFDFSAESFLKLFMAFRKSVWFRVAYLALLSVIVVGLYLTSAAGSPLVCFSLLAIPVLVFVIPYWLGERRTKHFLLNALPVFLAATLIIAAFQTDSTVNAGPVALQNVVGTDLTLWNGTVEPYKATAPQSFTFRVRLVTTPGVNVSAVRVWVNLSSLTAFTQSLQPVQMSQLNITANGTWWIATDTLDASIWGFYFFAMDNNGNMSYTNAILEPITAGWGDFYALWFAYIGQETLFFAVFYLLVVFLFWYTVRSRKLRERLMTSETLDKLEKSKEGEPGKEAAEETAGGTKAAKAAAFTCTNCGADVDEGDEKCPKCGAVFED